MAPSVGMDCRKGSGSPSALQTCQLDVIIQVDMQRCMLYVVCCMLYDGSTAFIGWAEASLACTCLQAYEHSA